MKSECPTKFPPEEILLIEDNPGDSELLNQSLIVGQLNVDVTLARDGEDAIRILLEYDSNPKVKNTRLIILDLNLPRKNGFEILAAKRRFKSITLIPTVVFTSSSNQQDILDCYALGANAYVVKPTTSSEYIATILGTMRFWFHNARNPYPLNASTSKDAS